MKKKKCPYIKYVAMLFALTVGLYFFIAFEMADIMDTSTVESFYSIMGVSLVFFFIITFEGLILLEHFCYNIKRFILIYKDCVREERLKKAQAQQQKMR